MNSLLKLFSLSGFVVGYMFLVLCIKLDSHFDFIVSLLGLWFLFFPGLALLFFFSYWGCWPQLCFSCLTLLILCFFLPILQLMVRVFFAFVLVNFHCLRCYCCALVY
jgi:hypothetical protein